MKSSIRATLSISFAAVLLLSAGFAIAAYALGPGSSQTFFIETTANGSSESAQGGDLYYASVPAANSIFLATYHSPGYDPYFISSSGLPGSITTADVTVNLYIYPYSGSTADLYLDVCDNPTVGPQNCSLHTSTSGTTVSVSGSSCSTASLVTLDITGSPVAFSSGDTLELFIADVSTVNTFFVCTGGSGASYLTLNPSLTTTVTSTAPTVTTTTTETDSFITTSTSTVPTTVTETTTIPVTTVTTTSVSTSLSTTTTTETQSETSTVPTTTTTTATSLSTTTDTVLTTLTASTTVTVPTTTTSVSGSTTTRTVTTTTTVSPSNVPTGTDLKCSPNPDQAGKPTLCTATVTAGNGHAPLGKVKFYSSSGGTFSSVSCSSTATSLVCKVTYIPPDSLIGKATSISAYYYAKSGSGFQNSHRKTTLNVIDPPKNFIGAPNNPQASSVQASPVLSPYATAGLISMLLVPISFAVWLVRRRSTLLNLISGRLETQQ